MTRCLPMLSMLSFLLLLLWGDESGRAAIPLAEAFSIVPRTIGNAALTTRTTRTPGRIHKSVPESTLVAPVESPSALNAWPSSFGSASKQSPKIGKDGLYHITTEEEYRILLEENPDKLVVLKVFSPWCKTCKAMAPKFQALAKGLGTKGNLQLPIIWISLAYSKDLRAFVTSTLKVRAVPSVILYAGNGVQVDSFPCGPPKVATVLQPKLVDLISTHIDHSTNTLKSTEAGTVAANPPTTTTTIPPQPKQQPSRDPQGRPVPSARPLNTLRSRWQQLVGTHSTTPLTNATAADAI